MAAFLACSLDDLKLLKVDGFGLDLLVKLLGLRHPNLGLGDLSDGRFDLGLVGL